MDIHIYVGYTYISPCCQFVVNDCPLLHKLAATFGFDCEKPAEQCISPERTVFPPKINMKISGEKLAYHSI